MLSLPSVNAPGSLRGAEGDGDGCASSLFLFFRTELPATTEGSDGDVTPRKDTREDFGLSFKLCPPRTVVGWL